MAKFSFDAGYLDGVEVSIGKLTALTPEERKKIIMAGAEALMHTMKKYLGEKHHRTGDLEESISIDYLDHFEVARVGPHSSKSRVSYVDAKNRKMQRDVRQSHSGSGGSKRSKHHGRTKASSMEEVGYYLEYGTPRMNATHWMEISVELAESEYDDAVESAWDEYLKSAGF